MDQHLSPSNYQVRRATLDDLVELRRLWHQTGYSATELEHRLTEFQVAETADGVVLGTIGLEVSGQHGRIHSEALKDLELAAELRPRLWDRLQTVARHRGLVWLWVEDHASLFWLEQGFEVAGREQLERLPVSFAKSTEQPWMFRKLREEPSALSEAELQFELFRLSQKEESERVLQRARLLRLLAGVLAVLVFGGVVLAGWIAWRIMQRTGRR